MFWLETLWDKVCGREWVYLGSRYYDKRPWRSYRVCKKSGKFQVAPDMLTNRWVTLDNRPVMRYIEGDWRLVRITRKRVTT